jgi:hypothetical protein
MEVKERHYEKVGEDFEQVHESYRISEAAYSPPQNTVFGLPALP